MFSSIEESSRPEVINKCYWPLLKLAEIAPIGIEAPALTLELINNIDPAWIKKLAELIKLGKVEFIGSGYSQIIGPLVPAKVNNWNQKLGLEVYGKLLGVRPKVALVNEMAYSGGIVARYLSNGYNAIIMEWNNPRSGHPEWKNEFRYYPQLADGAESREIPLIWADSIAFQKFQRYAHGEYDLKEYVNYLKTYLDKQDRYFPLYSNDVEIFDYRPGRYNTEARIENHIEWTMIKKLYAFLETQDWCELVFPSDVLNDMDNPDSGNSLKLESPEQPIPVKKQEKYNINRWGLTGRDDLGINTECYQIYSELIRKDNTNPEDWRELCYLWSSDFRTHITKNRWDNYQKRLKNTCNRWDNKDKKDIIQNSKRPSFNETDRFLIIENDEIKLVLNKYKGVSIRECVFKGVSDELLFGTLDHGYYDDISLGADYYSGHTVVEIPGKHKITDLNRVKLNINRINDSVSIANSQQNGNYIFKNKIIVNSTTLTIKKTLEVKSDQKSIIHPINITFNPEAWDSGSLYIQTHNGGNIIETFHLGEQSIAHGDIYSSLISAKHGFGNTEGIFIVGDKDKALVFECEMAISAIIPSIIYKEMEGTYFFRLQYSAREMDETKKIDQSPRIIQSFIKIIANKKH